MNYRVSERVSAFIIRKNAKSFYELLLLEHPGCEEAPIQIPGGGVESGESLEVALHREIHEESGLTNLTIVRKLGIAEHCWLDTQITTRRHCFLLNASCVTRDRWNTSFTAMVLMLDSASPTSGIVRQLILLYPMS
jgi:ADP-ribose pyrophosphatase YjhB (NUDIX family)